jgi:hypothetical protein
MKTDTEISPVQQELFEWAGQDPGTGCGWQNGKRCKQRLNGRSNGEFHPLPIQRPGVMISQKIPPRNLPL